MNMTTSKKITLATFKAFIRKNADRLYIMQRSHFDGMTDGLEYNRNPEFRPATIDPTKFLNDQHSLGMRGVWLVGESRDYFQPFDNAEFTGITAWNCCGEFTIAVRK